MKQEKTLFLERQVCFDSWQHRWLQEPLLGKSWWSQRASVEHSILRREYIVLWTQNWFRASYLVFQNIKKKKKQNPNYKMRIMFPGVSEYHSCDPLGVVLCVFKTSSLITWGWTHNGEGAPCMSSFAFQMSPLLDIKRKQFAEPVFLKICPCIRSERKTSSFSNHLTLKPHLNLCFSWFWVPHEHASCGCVHVSIFSSFSQLQRTPNSPPFRKPPSKLTSWKTRGYQYRAAY